jgi:hypothetical protein
LKGENIIVEECRLILFKQLPLLQADNDSIGKERNKAYQLGDLQGKFKEYELATSWTVLKIIGRKMILLQCIIYIRYTKSQIAAKQEAMKDRINSQFQFPL